MILSPGIWRQYYVVIIGPEIWRQYLVVIIANLGLLSVGWGLAWTSPTILKLTNENQTILVAPLSDEEGSWVVSIGTMLGIPAPLISGILADIIGRKMLLTAILFPKIVAWILIYFATNVYYLYVARSFLGIIDNVTFTLVPMYVSEIASNDNKGALGSCLQIFSTLGVVSMLCVGPFLSYHVLAIIGLLLSVAALAIYAVPESPYFLNKKGKTSAALKASTFIRGSESAAIEELKQYESETTTNKAHFSQLFASRASIKGLILAILLALFSQFTGFNAVMFYLQTVFESTKTNIPSSVSSAIIGATQLGGSITTLLIANRCGRKVILCSSSFVMAVGMLCLGLFFKLRDDGHPIEGFLQFLPLASIILVVFSYSGGFGSLIWPMMTEIFPDDLRAIGASIATTVLVTSVFVTTKFFAQLITEFGAYQTYWMFAVNNVLVFFIILFSCPETKGRTNSEIQVLLQTKLIQL